MSVPVQPWCVVLIRGERGRTERFVLRELINQINFEGATERTTVRVLIKSINFRSGI